MGNVVPMRGWLATSVPDDTVLHQPAVRLHSAADMRPCVRCHSSASPSTGSPPEVAWLYAECLPEKFNPPSFFLLIAGSGQSRVAGVSRWKPLILTLRRRLVHQPEGRVVAFMQTWRRRLSRGRRGALSIQADPKTAAPAGT